MELGAPPEVMADAYEEAWSLMSALETCQSNESVDVDDDCVPYHEPTDD